MWVFEEPRTEVVVLAPGDLEACLRPGDLDEALWSDLLLWKSHVGIGEILGLCSEVTD